VHGRTLKRVYISISDLNAGSGVGEDHVPFTVEEIRAASRRKIEKGTVFDKAVVRGWDATKHCIPYDVQKVVKTRQEGPFVVQFNQQRAQTRRPPNPDVAKSVTLPFDPEKFNFTKVKMEDEMVLKLEFTEDSSGGGGGDDGGDDGGGADGNNDAAATHDDYLLVNVSPLEFCHCLLVPDLYDRLPQVVTERSIRMAIQCVMASGFRSCKAAFNSLSGHASVNHLHWHLYYLREPYVLPVESVTGTILGGGVHKLDYSAVGFGFQTASKPTYRGICDIAKRVHAVASTLCQMNVAHNIFITRGGSLASGGFKRKVIKVLIWARKNTESVKNLAESKVTVAVCELSGQVIVYNDESAYESLTEQDIVEAHREACQETFEKVKDKVLESLKWFGPTEDSSECAKVAVCSTEPVDLASSDDETEDVKIDDEVAIEVVDLEDEEEDGDDQDSDVNSTIEGDAGGGGGGESQSSTSQAIKDILQQVRQNREKLLIDIDNDDGDGGDDGDDVVVEEEDQEQVNSDRVPSSADERAGSTADEQATGEEESAADDDKGSTRADEQAGSQSEHNEEAASAAASGDEIGVIDIADVVEVVDVLSSVVCSD